MDSFSRILNYQIVRPIGSGGMSTVYEGFDEKLRRQVAVKVLHPHLCSEPQAVERFRREALSAARLDHPNIVRIYDYLVENGMHCIVMEYVPGLDMETLIKRRGRLDIRAVTHIMHRIALALKVAHGLGLMHRDVKPSNILIHVDNRVMLSDFGLCKSSLETSLTVDNAVAGTPAFMSPEQMGGLKLTPATDVYSWAVTFYFLLAGKLPYASAEFAGLVTAIQNGRTEFGPEALSELPARTKALLERCLSVNPSDRLVDGAALVRELSGSMVDLDLDLNVALGIATESETDFRTEKSVSRRGFRLPFRKRARVALVAGLLAAGAAVWVYRGQGVRPVVEKTVVPTPVVVSDTATKASSVKSVVSSKKTGKPAQPVPSPFLSAALPETASVQPALPAVVDSGGFFFSCEPWANVRIDGRDVGRTPLESPLQLPAGRRAIRLANDFCEPLEDTVDIVKGQMVRKSYRLILKPGYAR